MNKSGMCENTFQTKYRVGDQFWCMERNAPKQFTISIIEVEIRENEFTVKYIGGGNRHRECDLDSIARTKEQLMQKVFGETK